MRLAVFGLIESPPEDTPKEPLPHFLLRPQANCNHIPPASGGKGRGFASPERKATPAPRYNPDVWRDVGAGFLKALLDAEGASVWSRLPQSKFRSLDRVSKTAETDFTVDGRPPCMCRLWWC